jgi:hypothetical protein
LGGFDEMDKVRGSGSAELLEYGSLEIAFERHHGDEAILKAQRATSSEACSVLDPVQNRPDNGQH